MNSSADKEVVLRWLTQTANLGGDTKSEFTETSAKFSKDWTYFTAINEYNYIDWSGFDSVSVYTKSEKDNLYTLHFQKPILEKIIHKDNTTLAVTEYEEDDGKSFSFWIAKSAGSYKESLLIAANRLKQLSKTDPSFKTATYAPPKKPLAITPSAPDTYAFIRSYFRNQSEAFKTFYYENGYLASKGFKVIYTTFHGSHLFIGYEEIYENYMTKATSKKIVNKAIDLSNIEKIELGSWGYNDKEVSQPTWVVYMTFIKKGESSSKSIDLPFDSISINSSPETLKSSQIFKALNHLRKLYGAPEPISFD